MKMTKSGKFFILMSVISAVLNSCVFDSKTFYRMKNCTKDTLLIELTESDSLDCWIYWGKNAEDTIIPVLSEDTIEIYINGRKETIKKSYLVLPDSFLLVDSHLFYYKDKYYVYAIKWNDAIEYSLDEIRAKKLYDRRTVTKKDFRNRTFEYRYSDSRKDN